MIYKLLSLPKDLVNCFHEIEDLPSPEWYCNSDPEDRKVGSGGGTTWLIEQWLKDNENLSLSDAKIIIHACGQSRRLPAYAPIGKILTPIPVFRWARGQKLNQTLLSLQLPLYERILKSAPNSLNTLVASGDVYIRTDQPIQEIPDADVVCFGSWVDASMATHHGVFVSSRSNPEKLDFMLQKPTLDELEKYSSSHYFLMDIGIWLLSEKALKVLSKKSKDGSGNVEFYDLYSDFGRALGENPVINDDEVNQLSVSILPLRGGEFYHFGTSSELISSTLELQNIVLDQRKILHSKIKPNPSLFVQNSLMEYRLSESNNRVWIENSNISKDWSLHDNHIITGVPENNWNIDVPSGICIDIVPISNNGYAVRPYGINDLMSGKLSEADTLWMGMPFMTWAAERNVSPGNIDVDIQFASIFPVVYDVKEIESVLKWMICEYESAEGKRIWETSTKISAAEISSNADLWKLYAQRKKFRKQNWIFLAENHKKSVFYQLDLTDVAQNYVDNDLDAPHYLTDDSPALKRIQNLMLISKINRIRNKDWENDEDKAFSILRNEILSSIETKVLAPRLSVYSDQIVWGRSPVRIDLAGGWTDTPPYSLYSGGTVVNMAIELNGQPPLQVYIKPSKEYNIKINSIDSGVSEMVNSFDDLNQFFKVGSPFSIPKAALYLAGIRSRNSFDTLVEFLRDFGSGIEITLMSAIPAGSGLGTSSILAATVLGALSDFCSLGWDNNEICNRTLALEQLLTSGGGWQDQYGGVLPGVKLLYTEDNIRQIPIISWLPQQIFTESDYRQCHLLYYTGLTRIAKGILSEIVRGMFLNSSSHLSILNEMKAHALELANVIQHNDFHSYGKMISKTWEQNKMLDTGTEPESIKEITKTIEDLCLGYKLPGAGGGGFLYIVAKAPDAAVRIREILTKSRPNNRARFVELSLSETGFQVTRS